MALLAHQKITYVIPGKPFGRGTLGAYSSATAPTMTKDSCSGTATSTTLTTAGSTFANGDLLKIIQMRGTGVGQWEIALVLSGGGTATLTLSKNLTYTYTDSGSSQAQAVKINEYTDVTVQTGTWLAPAWDGNVGGVLTFAAKGILTPTGTISATALGYKIDSTSGNINANGFQGEGTPGLGTDTYVANGNAGGGGRLGGGGVPGAGAGGSHATAGGNGTGAGAQNGLAGSVVGDTNLQAIFMGGMGGQHGTNNSVGYYPDYPGEGGAIISIFGKTINTISSLVSIGGNADVPAASGAGGGAGGSILICSQVVDIGTDKLSTVGGSGYSVGGAGGKGRIAVYYGVSLAGSISASLYGSYTNELDASLVESSGSSLMSFMV